MPAPSAPAPWPPPPAPRAAPRRDALLLALAVILLVGPLWLPGRVLAHGDTLIYFPTLYRAPWQGAWAPAIGLGTPAWPNPQTGAFYPPAWPLALGAAGAGWFAFHPLYVALHLWVGALGAAAWARRVVGAGLPALVAGLLVGVGGPGWSLALQPDKLPGYALAPVALWATSLLLDPRAPGDRAKGFTALWVAVALTWLGGSVEGMVATAGLVAAWAMLGPGPTRLASRLALAGGGGLVGVGVAACNLLPLLALLPHSTRRGGLDPAEAMASSLAPGDLLRLLVPTAEAEALLGALVSEGHYLDSLYLGVSGVALALLGLGHRPARRFALPAAGVALLLALGRHTPVYGAFLALPGMSTFQYPEKWALAAVPPLALLAAAGVQRLAPRPPLAAALTLLLAAELLASGRALWPTVRHAEAFSPPPLALAVRADWPRPEPPRLWDPSYQAGAPLPPRTDEAAWARELVALGLPNTAALHGLHYVFGADAFRLARVRDLVAAGLAAPPGPRRALLARLGADYWLVWDQAEALALAEADPALRPVAAAAGAPLSIGLLRDEGAWPRATWRDGALRVADGRAAREAVLGAPPQAVLAEADPVDPALWALVGAGRGRVEAVACTSPRPDRWTCRVDADAPGVLTLAVAWVPGWQVRVDGLRQAPASPADHALLAAFVPPGAHEVELRYRPPLLGPGLAVSALSLGVALLLRRRLRAAG